METFRIRTVVSDDSCTLMLRGEADLAVADDIVAVGTLGLAEPANSALIIDLNEVTFLDSTAIGALIQLRNLATDSDKRLQLAHVPQRIRRVLTLTGLADVFEQVSDRR